MSTELLEKTRVTRIAVQRLHNLGNYESIRYEVFVDIAPDDDAGKVLTTLEQILTDVQAKQTVSSYELERAKKLLNTPSEHLTDADKARIPECRELIRQHESVQERRAAARTALSALNYTSERKDAKDNWDEEDRY